MRIRVFLGLAGLVIGLALPTLGQQANTPDSQLRQRLVTATPSSQ